MYLSERLASFLGYSDPIKLIEQTMPDLFTADGLVCESQEDLNESAEVGRMKIVPAISTFKDVVTVADKYSGFSSAFSVYTIDGKYNIRISQNDVTVTDSRASGLKREVKSFNFEPKNIYIRKMSDDELNVSIDDILSGKTKAMYGTQAITHQFHSVVYTGLDFAAFNPVSAAKNLPSPKGKLTITRAKLLSVLVHGGYSAMFKVEMNMNTNFVPSRMNKDIIDKKGLSVIIAAILGGEKLSHKAQLYSDGVVSGFSINTTSGRWFVRTKVHLNETCFADYLAACNPVSDEWVKSELCVDADNLNESVGGSGKFKMISPIKTVDQLVSYLEKFKKLDAGTFVFTADGVMSFRKYSNGIVVSDCRKFGTSDSTNSRYFSIDLNFEFSRILTLSTKADVFDALGQVAEKVKSDGFGVHAKFSSSTNTQFFTPVALSTLKPYTKSISEKTHLSSMDLIRLFAHKKIVRVERGVSNTADLLKVIVFNHVTYTAINSLDTEKGTARAVIGHGADFIIFDIEAKRRKVSTKAMTEVPEVGSVMHRERMKVGEWLSGTNFKQTAAQFYKVVGFEGRTGVFVQQYQTEIDKKSLNSVMFKVGTKAVGDVQKLRMNTQGSVIRGDTRLLHTTFPREIHGNP